MSADRARAIKVGNSSSRDNIRLPSVPEDKNCKEIFLGVMAAVKMEGAKNVEFHVVHRIGKARDDGKPRAITAWFVRRQ